MHGPGITGSLPLALVVNCNMEFVLFLQEAIGLTMVIYELIKSYMQQ